MDRDRPCVALDRVVLLFTLSLQLLSLNLFAFALLALSVGHLLLALSLNQLAFSRVSLAFPVDGLGRGMLHGLPDTRERVTSIMTRSRRVLAVSGRLMRTSMALAQLRQAGKRVSARLIRRVVRT